MRKILTIFLSLTLAATAFTACRDKDDKDDKRSGSTTSADKEDNNIGSSASAEISEKDLETANAYAKTAYNGVSVVVADMAIDGQGIVDLSELGGTYSYPDFSGPSAEITEVLHDCFDEDPDFTGDIYIGQADVNGNSNALFIQYRSEEGSNVIGQYPSKSDKNVPMPTWGTWTNIIPNSGDIYTGKVTVDSANSYAKTIYNSISALYFDKETDGTGGYEWRLTTTGEYDVVSGSGPDSDVGDWLRNEFSSIGGIVYVGQTTINGNANSLFVQWRPDENSKLIGQYPNAPESVDDMPEWGVYTNYFQE